MNQTGPILTVFLGIYNGTAYLDSLKFQLKEQINQNFALVVVDNCSQDASWEQLQSWKSEFGSSLTLIRNSENLGGGGSLEKSLRQGLIKTPWFVMMHQDDYYLPNHLETLENEILKSSEKTVGICTSMGSMDKDGIVSASFPRAAWLIDDSSQLNSFLINVRLQAFSFPSAAVKTNIFMESMGFWHSPSFSDTETTLNLITRGEIKYLKFETMRYRENPISESHVINTFESIVGAGIGLGRVINSEGFRDLLGTIDEDTKGKFFLELMSSIEIRIPDSAMCSYLKILAAEECCFSWGYSEIESSKFLSSAYASVDSRFTSTSLSSRIGEKEPQLNIELEKSLRKFSNQFNTEIFSLISTRKSENLGINLISRLPLWVKTKLFKLYVRVHAIKQPNYYWNIFWK
ncbi:Glycosyltransferase 2-like [Candidatus Nanopelagicaceae bacterium]